MADHLLRKVAGKANLCSCQGLVKQEVGGEEKQEKYAGPIGKARKTNGADWKCRENKGTRSEMHRKQRKKQGKHAGPIAKAQKTNGADWKCTENEGTRSEMHRKQRKQIRNAKRTKQKAGEACKTHRKWRKKTPKAIKPQSEMGGNQKSNNTPNTHHSTET